MMVVSIIPLYRVAHAVHMSLFHTQEVNLSSNKTNLLPKIVFENCILRAFLWFGASARVFVPYRVRLYLGKVRYTVPGTAYVQ